MSALECPVCLEAYDGAQHEPKILPCSGAHELCNTCLRLLRAQAPRNFSCPECREKIDTSARINTNRGLLAALQSGSTTASSAATTAPRDRRAPGDPLRAPNNLSGETSHPPTTTGGSLCSVCKKKLPKDAFSRVQLAKNATSRRCKVCISATESSALEAIAHEQRSPATDAQPSMPKVFNVSLWCAEAAASCPEAVRREMGSGTPLKVLRQVEAGGQGNFDKMRQDPHCTYPELASVCLTCGMAPPSGGTWSKCSRCGIASYCCASHQKIGWRERGHKETCGWYLPTKPEVMCLAELSIPAVVRILVLTLNPSRNVKLTLPILPPLTVTVTLTTLTYGIMNTSRCAC